VTAIDAAAQGVIDTDATHYFGLLAQNADFNGSGLVDAADYVIWRKFNGTTGGATQSQGDANNNGAVDNDDYLIWQQQFGSTPGGGGGSAAQEPPAASAVALEPVSESPVALDDSAALSPAAQDAALGLMHSYASEARSVVRRPIAALRHRLAERVHGADWQAILAALAERRASRERPSAPTESDAPASRDPISADSVADRLLNATLLNSRAGHRRIGSR
jgi:hypothetical protein